MLITWVVYQLLIIDSAHSTAFYVFHLWHLALQLWQGTNMILTDHRTMVDLFHNACRLIECYIFCGICHKKKDRSYKIGKVGNQKQTMYFTRPYVIFKGTIRVN